MKNPNIIAISREINTQDNRSTCDPMFLVQKEEIIYGIDSQYFESDDINYLWLDTDLGFKEGIADDEQAKDLNFLATYNYVYFN